MLPALASEYLDALLYVVIDPLISPCKQVMNWMWHRVKEVQNYWNGSMGQLWKQVGQSQLHVVVNIMKKKKLKQQIESYKVLEDKVKW